MPNPRQCAIAASAETHALFPWIPQRSGTDPTSYLYTSTNTLPHLPQHMRHKLRTATIEGEPFDVAIGWQSHSFGTDKNNGSFPFSPGADGVRRMSDPTNRAVFSGQRAPPIHYKSILDGQPTNRIVVLNTANEKKPGGEWLGGTLAQEEGFARRSNLVQTLESTVHTRSSEVQSYYPLPQRGAIYSPSVVVFREGFKLGYTVWPDEEWTTVSVISAPAVKRPRTDEKGMTYSFSEEKNLQRDKMKTILRVAAMNGHINLVLGGFGSCGPDGSGTGIYRNPIGDVCDLWNELLFQDEEFNGWFANIVFALGDKEQGGSWVRDDISYGVFKNVFGG